jgi:Fe-Mn family superoxide dismutase
MLMPFQPLQAKDWVKLKPSLHTMEGISEKTITEHYKLYQGYVTKFNEIMALIEQLPPEELTPPKPNPTYSQIRELKVELTRAIGGVKHHELYFSNLGGRGGEPPTELREQIEKDFGSYERFVQEFRATAIAARGWAWLAWDYDFERLIVCIGDEQNTFPIWNATPILTCDMFEHAFLIDFGTNRVAYIDAFFRNLDWEDVAARFEAVRKIAPQAPRLDGRKGSSATRL